MEKFQIGLAGKDATQTVTLNTVPLAQLIRESKATGIQPSRSTKPGVGNRVFLMNGDKRATTPEGKEVCAIRVSGSIVMENDHMTPEGLQELIQKEDKGEIVVYWGISDKEQGFSGNFWMAFGKKGEFTPGKVYNFADLKKAVGAMN